MENRERSEALKAFMSRPSIFIVGIVGIFMVVALGGALVGAAVYIIAASFGMERADALAAFIALVTGMRVLTGGINRFAEWIDKITGVEGIQPGSHLAGAERFMFMYDADTEYPWGQFFTKENLPQMPLSRIEAAAKYLMDRNYVTSSFGGKGKPITRSEGEAYRDWLIANKLAKWTDDRNHNMGWEINRGGINATRIFAGDLEYKPSPPPPGSFDGGGWKFMGNSSAHTDAQTIEEEE